MQHNFNICSLISVPGSYPDYCECFTEIEEPVWIEEASRPVSYSSAPADTEELTTSDNNSSLSSTTHSTETEEPMPHVVGTVLGVRLDCRRVGLTSFPRDLPANTITM